MDDCIFCKIVNGLIPSQKILENDDFLAFLDIRPITDGHTIIIPKKHYRWVYDVVNFGDYWEFAKEVTSKIQQSLHPEFVSYLTMGNEVPHAHIHLLPRYPNDNLVGLFNDNLRQSKTAAELQTIADKINL